MDDSEPHRIDALMQRHAPRGSPKGRDARFVYIVRGRPLVDPYDFY